MKGRGSPAPARAFDTTFGGAFDGAAIWPLALIAILACSLLALSCGGRLNARVDAGGGAEISVSAAIPASIAAKLRELEGRPATTPLFAPAAVRDSLLARQGLRLRSLSNPDPDSIAFTVTMDSLAKALAAPDIAGPGLIRLVSLPGENGQGGMELVIRFERGKGSALAALAPGIDRELMEALSPPAFDSGGDFSKAEYRQALGGLLGTKILPDLDAATLDCAIALPGSIVSQTGGKTQGSTWSFSLSLLDLLVLERPLEFRVRWKP